MKRARQPADHYSYAAYADPEMARSFEGRRFGGPIGEYVAESQARVLAGMAGPVEGRAVVDVGTGTGRAAILMARAGARVTGIDASEQMLEVARRQAAAEHLAILFERGDAHALPYADGAFDIAMCLRVLMHAPDWRRCLAELCRVSARLVIFDYPSAASVALLESISRRAAHSVGVRTEAYRVLTARTVREELQRSRFRVRSVHRQFVMPIQFHKAIGSRRFTTWSEGVLDRAGLLRHFGSPVTVAAERCAS